MGLYVYTSGTLFEAIMNHYMINSLPVQAPVTLLNRRDTVDFGWDLNDTAGADVDGQLERISAWFR